jgi:Tfp pilus assembly protein FimT
MSTIDGSQVVVASDRDRQEDAGITLSELLISMMIMSIVLVVCSALMVSTVRYHRMAAGKVDTHADSRILMLSLTRDLRVATAIDQIGGSITTFEAANPYDMTFYAGGNGAPTKVTYGVDGTSSCLRRTTVPGVKNVATGVISYPTSGTKTNCVSSGKVATVNPIFVYNKVPNGAGDVVPATLPGEIALIGNVTITLSITSPTRPEVAPTDVTQTVTLVNQTNALNNGASR